MSVGDELLLNVKCFAYLCSRKYTAAFILVQFDGLMLISNHTDRKIWTVKIPSGSMVRVCLDMGME